MYDAATVAKIKLGILEKDLSKKFHEINQYTLDPEKLKNRNIENFIGSVDLPVGFAGPVAFSRSKYKGTHYITIGTTEGALVASIARGLKAINQSGGAYVYSKYNGATRAPLFKIDSLKGIIEAEKSINKLYPQWKKIAESISSHLKVLKYYIFNQGRYLWLRINFDTDEAMGMNMASIASSKISEFLIKKIPKLQLVAVSGNLCTDKKPALINTILKRGYEVQAEVVIKADVLESVLKINSKIISEINRSKVWYGGAIAGSLGFNAHSANIIAGIYAATGQDLAQVVDSSLNYVSFEETDNGAILATVNIPTIMMASIGGGTGLAKQKEYCDIMLKNIGKDKYPGKNAQLLAELTGVAVLAGELSLAASMGSNNFICAHENLGRGKNELPKQIK